MVTRRVIRISSKEAEALKPAPPAEASTSVAAVAVVDSLNNNNDTITKTQSKSKTPLCNHLSCTRRAQLPSQLCWKHGAQALNVICKFTGCNKKGILLGLCPDHGGLVQLCQWRGCINTANLEKRGGLCWMHRMMGQHDDDNDSSEEEEDETRLCRSRGCISRATTDDGLCDRHSTNESDEKEGKKKSGLAPWYSISDNDANKRQRVDAFAIDLSDVPPLRPIPKSAGRVKDGASKFTGVSFSKGMNKWQAHIAIKGKHQHIGYYENEEEAAVDYARALFKYRGQGALDKAMGERKLVIEKYQSLTIDLSDVPPQPPIPKSEGRMKEGASKYTGVSFNKKYNKWQAQIMIGKKQNCIGFYENEEEAAVDYARALFKYKGQGELDKATGQKELDIAVDISDVPPQPPIHKSVGRIKEGASKYTGVSFVKKTNKWSAQIMIGKKQHCIGYYESEEKAAVDYARALFKYKRNELRIKDGTSISDRANTTNRHRVNELAFDLSDVPPQPPIPKSAGRVKDGASKYTGVSFNKQMKKWTAHMKIDGKARHIGTYENEEDAAVDYARALFKYKGQGEQDKATEQKELDIAVDVSDVPPQPPIPKSEGRMKEGASKYTGVSFNKVNNKWQAQIKIGKKQHLIGYYGNEEEAAVDYARALFKYKRSVISRPQNSFVIDLDDVPPQPLILKNDLSRSKEYSDNTRRRNVKEGSSKYTGVYFAKDVNKWKAQIMIDGRVRSIGYYEIEEDAAADYARAAFKYKPKRCYDTYGGLDLIDVPDQPLIYSETNKSGFMGVKKNKSRWEATLNGKNLGTFDTKEEAAGIYARARYYIEREGGEPSKDKKKKAQRSVATVPEEAFDLVAV